MSIVLDGRALARQCEGEWARRVRALGAPAPVLATVQVGSDPASSTYVRMKHAACQRIGMVPRSYTLSANASEHELLRLLQTLNADTTVTGILLQHPIAPHMNSRRCFDAIALAKDVDGVHADGFGRMAMGSPAWVSCTPLGIMRLLAHHDIEVTGLHAVVVGRSAILGKPLAAMLTNAHATVTLCHSKTRHLPELIGHADLVCAAVGRPQFIQAQWIADNAIVVDAGYHPGRVGDVAMTAALKARLAAFTPVPGGVGPMTINTLLMQTVAAAEKMRRQAPAPGIASCGL